MPRKELNVDRCWYAGQNPCQARHTRCEALQDPEEPAALACIKGPEDGDSFQRYARGALVA